MDERQLQSLPRLSVTLRTFFEVDPPDWSVVLDRAQMFEAAGIDRLVVSDHVVFGDHLEEYARPELGGREGGRQPTGPQGRWLEPLTVLAMVAARTSKIRLGTSILLAALRRPVVLAKTVATVDVLSGGRLDLGVGVGWQRAEYEAAGLEFGDRGRLLDTALAQCTALWAPDPTPVPTPVPTLVHDGVPNADGSGVVHQWPKPVQQGGPGGATGVPLWISGRSTNPKVIARIQRFGAGWIPWGDDAEDPVPGLYKIRGALQAVGRSAEGFEVTAALPDTRSEFRRLVEAGVTDFRLSRPAADEAGLGDQVEKFRSWRRDVECA